MRIARKAFALVAFYASVLPGNAQMPREEFDGFLQKVKAGTIQIASTPEIDAIEAAMREGDAKTGLRLSEAAVAAPAIPDESPQFNAWIKSKAYLYRGMATHDVTKDAAKAVADIEESAGLGNARALGLLLDNFLKTPEESVFGGYRPSEEEVRRYFVIAAELVTHGAVEALAAGNVPGASDRDEQTYWKMLAHVVWSARTSQIRELMKLTAEMGAETLDSIEAKYGLAGAPFEATNQSVPGRNLMATLYADDHLRYMLASSLGAHSIRKGPDESADTTVMQNFLFLSTLASLTGFADLYLLVPGKPASQEKNIRYLDRKAVVAEIHPGDNLWISCGALSHTATVFRIDPATDTLSLVDANYEFWQPVVNSCVKSFKHEHYKYGFYLPTLKLSEVVPMIDAIGTYRTAEWIGYSGYVPEALPPEESLTDAARDARQCAPGLRPADIVGRPATDLMKSDLMRFFNFVKLRTESRSGGARLEIYKPSAREMYGEVGLIAALDGKSCVHSLSLTVRRSFFEDQKTTMFARDIILSFLGQVTAPSENGTPIVNVLAGKAPVYDSGHSPDHLRMENITASNGAPLLRITIW